MLKADFSSYQKDVHCAGTKLHSAVLFDIKFQPWYRSF